HAPVRLGPKTHVRAMNVLMKRRLSVVTGFVKLGDLFRVVPPLTHPHQTQHHAGPMAELAYQPIATSLSVGVRRCVPVPRARSRKHGLRVAEAGRARGADVAFIDCDEVNVLTELPGH